MLGDAKGKMLLIAFLVVWVSGVGVLGVTEEEGEVIDDFEKLNFNNYTHSNTTRDLFSIKWNKTTIKWHLINRLEGMRGRRQHRIVGKAFAQWARHASLKFVEVEDPAVADIRLGFYREEHGDIAPFDGAGGTAAHAFLPRMTDANSGDVHLDSEEEWTIGSRRFRKNHPDLMSILIHEIGHSLGLGHSKNSRAVMFKRYNKVKRHLAKEDKERLVSLYTDTTETHNTQDTQTVLYILDRRMDAHSLSATKHLILSNIQNSCQGSKVHCNIGIAQIPSQHSRTPTVTTANIDNNSHFLPSNQISITELSETSTKKYRPRQAFPAALRELQTICERHKVCWDHNGHKDCRCNGHVEIHTGARHKFTKGFGKRLRKLNLGSKTRIPIYVHVSRRELTTAKGAQLRKMKQKKTIDFYFTE